MGLTGLVAVVTGGAGGIGRGVADQLLRAGASVALVSRGDGALSEAVGALSVLGEVVSSACDVTSEAAVSQMISDVCERLGRLDILVCSHGVMTGGYTFLDFPLERWRETIEVNLVGAFICGRAAARAMVSQRTPGRIINISSITALGSPPGLSAYNASKGGIEALTRSMAVDLADHGITVNSIAPGRVRTPMVAELPPDGPATNPVGRGADPNEIGRVAAWLADPDSSFITGSTIVVDGGRRARL